MKRLGVYKCKEPLLWFRGYRRQGQVSFGVVIDKHAHWTRSADLRKRIHRVDVVSHYFKESSSTHSSVFCDAIFMSTQLKEYTGGCHCGKFRYTFTGPIFEDGSRPVDRCNCGFCVKKGALWQYVRFFLDCSLILLYLPDRPAYSSVPEAQFTLTQGSMEELTLYEFHKKVFKHYFCPTCGVQCFLKDTRPELETVKVEVNTRTVDGVDPEKLSVRLFDGQNLL